MSNNSRKKPDFLEETKLRKMGYKFIAGVDEAGRGPLAGNITAAAVMFPAKLKIILREINDSKKLTPIKREKLYKILTTKKYIKWSVASVSAKVIDKIGIHKATHLAMLRAIKKTRPKPDFIIFDGLEFKNKSLKQCNKKFIVKADAKTMSCAAASIIAKVTRDKSMLRLHKKYPQYGFDRHKGYGAKKHFDALKKNGPCPSHRKTFEPLKSWFER